jgi:MFS family permease
LLIGFGGGLFSHGTLTATMNSAPKAQIGLALGAWGAVQATAAGVAVALGGIGRDVMTAIAANGTLGQTLSGPAVGYAVVYSVEIVLLIITIFVMTALIGSLARSATHDERRRPRQPRLNSPGLSPSSQQQLFEQERAMEVYQIVLLLWVVVFGLWVFKQFGDYNKRK